MTTLAIIGSRGYDHYEDAKMMLDAWFTDRSSGRAEFDRVVSGGAVGADSLGARWAREMGLPVVEHLPDWEAHGRGAGFIRNEAIIKDANVVVAFWDGKSKGTGNSLSIAKRLKKTTVIFYI